MKKFLALICAAPALLFASGVHAQTYQISAGINLGAFCSVATATASTIGSITPSTSTATATSATFAWTSNFTDGYGHVPNVGGNVALTVSANSTCTYTLSATHGAMVGSSGNNLSVPYQAGLASGTSQATLSPVTGGAGATIGSLSLTSSGLGTQTVDVAFQTNSPSTAQYAKDTYTETMTLTIVAS